MAYNEIELVIKAQEDGAVTVETPWWIPESAEYFCDVCGDREECSKKDERGFEIGKFKPCMNRNPFCG